MKTAIYLGLTAALTLASAALAADGPNRPDRDHRGRAERADANGDGAVTLQESQAASLPRPSSASKFSLSDSGTPPISVTASQHTAAEPFRLPQISGRGAR